MTTQRTARLHPDTMPVLVVATLLAGGLAAVSFALSFFSLRAVSSWAGISSGLAWAVPVMLDSAILVYTLAILVKRARHERAIGTWATVTLWTAVSVGANAAHAAGVPTEWQRAVGTVVAALAPIAVLLATHTIADLIVAPVPDNASAVEPVTVLDTVPDNAASAVQPDTDTRPDTIESGQPDTVTDNAASAGQPETETLPDTARSGQPDTSDGGRRPVSVPSVTVHRHRTASRGRAADRRTDILALHEQGLSVRAIAKEVGLGHSSVHSIVRTAGAMA